MGITTSSLCLKMIALISVRKTLTVRRSSTNMITESLTARYGQPTQITTSEKIALIAIRRRRRRVLMTVCVPEVRLITEDQLPKPYQAGLASAGTARLLTPTQGPRRTIPMQA
jgi:hypothetical protein